MPTLHAEFSVTLPEPFKVHGQGSSGLGDADGTISESIAIQQFASGEHHCRLELLPDIPGPSFSTPEGEVVFEISAVRIRVSREEPEPLPSAPVTGTGGRDLTARASYFGGRRSEFIEVARTVTDNLIQFGRYRLGIPGARGVADLPPGVFDNPEWSTDAEESITSGILSLTLSMDGPERLADLGIKPLGEDMAPSLGAALSGTPQVPLHRELQAAAKDAAAAGDLGRAVMELAVSCEVGVKQAFFAPASAAYEAFGYLEEKGKVRAPVIELLKEPARRAFGESFKHVSPATYKSIDHLFRCRNTVAHRGCLEYRDDGNELHIADGRCVLTWWHAAEELLTWLESACHLQGITGL